MYFHFLVIIGFRQVHYKVNENAGCVEVCVEVLAGEIRAADSVTVEFAVLDIDAVGRSICT